MTRKIIQIAATSASADTNETVYALCDDGSLWELRQYPARWYPVIGLPDEPPDTRPPRSLKELARLAAIAEVQS
jgi:hypothetical protein